MGSRNYGLREGRFLVDFALVITSCKAVQVLIRTSRWNVGDGLLSGFRACRV
jgi:hypothetical protein